ncbi:MAG TPA: hypothetical protein PLB01_00090 [Thermoanaerobaculia bacterium]|nr:hypothetical protein [Thermoanaerobaculia bacterium]
MIDEELDDPCDGGRCHREESGTWLPCRKHEQHDRDDEAES